MSQELGTQHLCPVQLAAERGWLRGPVDRSWCWSARRAAVLENEGVGEAPLLYADRALRIRYAPFDWVNPDPRVTFVGITPGPTQLARAVAEAAAACRRGLPDEEALRRAKFAASFSGTVMRRNLVAMLDDIGLAAALGIPTCAALFDEHTDLLHPTSAVVYPTFTADGEPYRGVRPAVAAHPVLKNLAAAVLAADLELAGESLVVPLGRPAGEAVAALVAEGRVDPRRVLPALPHPSGANGHRARLFQALRDDLAARVRRWAA